MATLFRQLPSAPPDPNSHSFRPLIDWHSASPPPPATLTD
ncbi:hypothetical protein J009_02179 [Cryptococcus neoformans]|nr:hypothetical protein J009_02179 [Cryptococcus neoformans var. grubii]OXH72092.1 hypothetical protein J000_02164 [Cryptococcus neoformans var. grubii]